MVLHHPYKEASLTQIHLKEPLDESHSFQELLALLKEMNDWLDMSEAAPWVYNCQQSRTIYILYRSAVLVIDDFWNYAALSMACINEKCPICAFGTADNQDSVRLSAETDGNDICLLQQTISGDKAEIIRTLCFQIDCSNFDDAEKVTKFLTSMDWQVGIAVMNWHDAYFLQGQDVIIVPEYNSHFCYIGLEKDVSKNDLLNSLTFSHKTDLWIVFLKDDFEPTEFEWLVEAISNDSLYNRIEWELSLREAMNQLHFKVINLNNDFEIYDGMGKRRYFGANLRHPAEWAMLKLLFPINN